MNRCLVVNHSIHLYTHTNHTHPPILTQIFQAVCERAELRHILEAVRHLAPDALHSVEQKLGRELHSVLHPPPQSHSLQNPAHPPVSTNQIISSHNSSRKCSSRAECSSPHHNKPPLYLLALPTHPLSHKVPCPVLTLLYLSLSPSTPPRAPS